MEPEECYQTIITEALDLEILIENLDKMKHKKTLNKMLQKACYILCNIQDEISINEKFSKQRNEIHSILMELNNIEF